MRTILFIFLFTSYCTAFSQAFEEEDSLLIVLKTAQNEDKVNTLLLYSDKIISNSPKKSLDYINQALKLAQSINYIKGIGESYTKIGIVHRVSGNYIKAIENYNLGLKTLENTQHKKELAYLLLNIGVVHVDQNHYDMALEYYNRSMNINKEIQDDRGYSINLHTIGWVYQKKKDYEKALLFYKKSLQIAHKVNSDLQKMICNSTIGQVYRLQGNYKKAIKVALNNLQLSQKQENKINLAFAREDLAKAYEATQQYEKALFNATKSYQLWLELDRMEGVRTSSEILAKIYAIEKNFTEAYKYHKIFKTFNDSIYNLEQSQTIAEFQARYDSEKKEAENKLLRKEQELKDAIIKKQQTSTLFIGTGLFLLAILVVVLYIAYSQKIKSNNLLRVLNEEINLKQEEIIKQSSILKQANFKISNINHELEKKVEERTKQLAKSNKELDAFLYHSSHDLKRPITTLKGLLEISKMTSKEKTSLELFRKIKDTTFNMEKLLKKLMMIGEINYENKDIISCNVFNFIKEIEEHLLEENKDLPISFKIYCEENLNVYTYPSLLYFILFNLLENAINFRNQEKPKIFIEVSYQKEELLLFIKDNGIGIPKEYHDKIFDMFFIGTTVSKGNGLGLYVVQKAIDWLSGKITFHSCNKSLTEFVVSIPVKSKIENAVLSRSMT